MKAAWKQQLRRFAPALLAIMLVCGALFAPVWAEDSLLIINPSDLASGDSVLLASGWRFHPGDDPAWSEPDYDDAEWPQANSNQFQVLAPDDWSGVGWFRLRFRTDSTLRNRLLALKISVFGAGEFYFDGVMVHRLGRVGLSRNDEETALCDFYRPIPIQLSGQSEHVLAVRLSNHIASEYHPEIREVTPGFRLVLTDWRSGLERYLRQVNMALRHQMLLTGLASAFCLLHLFMYLFYRAYKPNLYFTLFTASIALLSFAPAQMGFVSLVSDFYWLATLTKLAIIGTTLFGLLLVNKLFYPRTTAQAKVIIAAGAVLAAGSWFFSRDVVYIYAFVGLVETARVVVVAVVKRKSGSWIIGTGFLIFMLAASYQMLIDMRLLPMVIPGFWYWYLYGILALLISISVFLARQFAGISSDLAHQLDNVRTLSARAIGQERRAKQQEIARRLLEKEVEHQKKELQEAKKLEKALSDLEKAHNDLRRAQAQLVQSEKMASLGMLVAGVAHEINTPVGAIYSMHDTLKRAVDKLKHTIDTGKTIDPQLRQDLQQPLGVIDEAGGVIESGSRRVADIVKRLRSFARLDEAELKKADINEGLEDTLTLIHHQIKHDIELVREYGKLPLIACYPGQLNQVFLNLLINARQAIEGKGRIRVATRLRGEQVAVEIEDNGSGIPADKLDRIFDPGFTTKGVGVGTGLGLSICYQIIQAHRGEITVKSVVGEGTTFTILLPTDLEKTLENG